MDFIEIVFYASHVPQMDYAKAINFNDEDDLHNPFSKRHIVKTIKIETDDGFDSRLREMLLFMNVILGDVFDYDFSFKANEPRLVNANDRIIYANFMDTIHTEAERLMNDNFDNIITSLNEIYAIHNNGYKRLFFMEIRYSDCNVTLSERIEEYRIDDVFHDCSPIKPMMIDFKIKTNERN